MATFVLVPGAWLGGWAWRRVARPLRGAGHEVYPVTLTGLAERVHLGGPGVSLETHVTDIVNLFEYEDLRDAVLVGHSYGGVPVCAAADRLADRLAAVVYLAGGPLADGTGMLDLMPPTGAAALRRSVEEHGGGWQMPVPSWGEPAAGDANLDGLSAEDLALLRARAVPHPFGTYTGRVWLTGAAAALPQHLVTCDFPLATVKEMVAAGHPFFAGMTGPGWTEHELLTSHWPMLSRPGDTAALLAEIAG